MNNNLLTSSEIESILDEATNSKYQDPSFLNLETSKTSIFRVSKIHKLILIKGNQSTGLEHIEDRHSPFSRVSYWAEGKLENQSKFDLSIGPLEYLDIANQLFKSENINLKNRDLERFVRYTGVVHIKNSIENEYTMFLYRNTKIIHTMFPSSNKKPFNKKKILNLRQGWTDNLYLVKPCIGIYSIPYYDDADIERYILLNICHGKNQTSNWYIQVNTENGTPFLTTRIKEVNKSSDPYSMIKIDQIDFNSPTWFEKEIKKIIEGNFDF